MPTVRGEFRSLFPTLAVTLLFPVPLLNFVRDGTGRAFAFAYLFFGCALLAAECFRPTPASDGEGTAGTVRERRAQWNAKMGALTVAMALAALSFSVCYCAISGHVDGSAVVLAFLVVVPALGIVPCLTRLVGGPYVAVAVAALLLGALKIVGCLLVRVVYGPTAQAEGYMAMSWDNPNLLVWFCLAGGLVCSAVLGVLGFRLASFPARSRAA